jgi:hypothetical protein
MSEPHAAPSSVCVIGGRRVDGRQVITKLFRGCDTWPCLILCCCLTLILFGLASGLNFSGGGVTAVFSYSLGVAGSLNLF